MANYATQPAKYATLLDGKIKDIASDQLHQLLSTRNAHNTSCWIITIHPKPNDPSNFEVGFASRRVFEILWERRIHDRIEDIRHFYNLFTSNPVTSVAGGWTFELRLHQLLPKKQEIKLFTMTRHAALVNFLFNNHDKPSGPTIFKLPASQERELSSEVVKLKENSYYRPKSKNHPTIDSLLLFRNGRCGPCILLMFQFTLAQSHDVNLRGLEGLDKLQIPPGTKRYYVVVTPEFSSPTIVVPKQYVIEKEKRQESFEVLHLPVTPKYLFE